MEKFKNKPEYMLMNAIGFTEEDLEANRKGRFSPAQYEKLTRQRGQWGTVLLVVLVVVFPISSVLSIAGFQRREFFIVAIFALVAAIFAGVKWNKENGDYKIGKVESVEGRVKLDVEEGKSITTFLLRIQKWGFRVGKPVFLAFKNGDPYIIYFMPYSKRILSVEWLREG